MWSFQRIKIARAKPDTLPWLPEEVVGCNLRNFHNFTLGWWKRIARCDFQHTPTVIILKVTNLDFDVQSTC
jgi:hypothetical protein